MNKKARIGHCGSWVSQVTWILRSDWPVDLKPFGTKLPMNLTPFGTKLPMNLTPFGTKLIVLNHFKSLSFDNFIYLLILLDRAMKNL